MYGCMHGDARPKCWSADAAAAAAELPWLVCLLGWAGLDLAGLSRVRSANFLGALRPRVRRCWSQPACSRRCKNVEESPRSRVIAKVWLGSRSAPTVCRLRARPISGAGRETRLCRPEPVSTAVSAAGDDGVASHSDPHCVSVPTNAAPPGAVSFLRSLDLVGTPGTSVFGASTLLLTAPAPPSAWL
ncbi:hypothetical protein L1887_55107 [Cichorium endivia]|nr:hypothetical protein L1887_55107 [Cichorium endivia]